MMRLPRGGAGVGRAGRGGRAAHGARRAWPIVMMAWERLQSLSPDQKERYKSQAKQFAGRGRSALQQKRRRRPPG